MVMFIVGLAVAFTFVALWLALEWAWMVWAGFRRHHKTRQRAILYHGEIAAYVLNYRAARGG